MPDPDYYPSWVTKASLLCIAKRYEEAKRVLKEAKRMALLSLEGRRDKRGYRLYPDYGFYGDTSDNLKEIRQRLSWLRRREYNHALLYRPYDFDLQVPPYRLGAARGPE
ncbi:MAG: hypothetical protein ACAH95_14565 [Fimbriimonas sp.]